MVTAWVAIANDAAVSPGLTNTDAGTVARAWLLARATLTPAEGAGPSSMTVPIDCCPPTNEVGFSARDLMEVGFTVNDAETDLPPVVAVTFIVLAVVTWLGAKRKVACSAPGPIETDLGPPHKAEEAERITLTCALGAGELIDTVPVIGLPPATAVGVRLIDVKTGAVTTILVVFEFDPMLALMVAVIFVATGMVVTPKVVEVFPLGTVMSPATDAAPLDEFNDTILPPTPAAADRVTVPHRVLPPETDAEGKVRLLTVWDIPRAGRKQAKIVNAQPSSR